MKKWISVFLLASTFTFTGSCTNDEGGSDIDVITPSDEDEVQLQRLQPKDSANTGN